MNFSFAILLVIELITLVSNSEAWPNWGWGHTSKPSSTSHTRYGDKHDGCFVGHCVRVWECPDHAAALEPTGHCSYLVNGPWVCCNEQDIISHENHPKDKKVHLTITTENSLGVNPISTPKQKRTTIYKNQWVPRTTVKPKGGESTYLSRRSTTKYTKQNPENGILLTTPYVKEWNKNSKEKTTVPSYWKKTTENARVGPTSNEFWDKATEVPALKEWKKTTKNTWHNHQTPRTSQKPTSQTSVKSTANVWRKPSTPKSTLKLLTNTWFKPTESGMKNKTTRTPLWAKPTPYPGMTTTRSHASKTTSSVWKQQPTRSTPKKEFGKTTFSVSRITPKTTRASLTRTSTAHTKYNPSTAKSTRTNQVWENSFTKAIFGGGRPTPADAKRESPPKVGHVRTTANLKDTLDTNRRSTTKRYRVTTPLPDINEQTCGIRERKPARNQPARSNRRANAGDTIIFRDSREDNGRRPFQRIVGGKEVEPFSWPWVAALYKVTAPGGNRFLSAGSLINENFILTAAHIFTPDDLRTSSYVVMLGTHTAKEAFAEYVVSSVLLHPDYEHRYYYNDIALLKLERPVRFNDYVMPICLPSPDAPLLRDRDLVGRNVTVMGWGDDSFGGKSSRVLKEATFPIVSRQACNASYVQVASNRFPKGITDQMLCAGAPNGGKDACQGDSGGPLTTFENGRYTQVGIVSFGYKCGDKEFPGVYTKVAPYLNWIAENTLHASIYDDYDS